MVAFADVSRGVVGGARDAEVDEVREVVVVHQDVGRFDVAVHQPGLVGVVQRRRDLLDDRHRARRVERSGVEQGLQVDAVDQPHGHVQATVDLADVVDRHDVGIVQACRGAGLAAEPLLEIGVLGEVGEQHLQRHDAVDGGVVGAPHLAHAAAAQQLDQPVAAERRALLHRLTITADHRVCGGDRGVVWPGAATYAGSGDNDSDRATSGGALLTRRAQSVPR